VKCSTRRLPRKRKTLLHDFIDLAIYLDLEYVTRKAPEAVAPDFLKTLAVYQAAVEDEASYADEDQSYAQYLFLKMQEHVLLRVSAEVFNLLFQDRGTLKAFNLLIAERVIEMEEAEYPGYLKRDGVFKRCSYWPSWLVDGLTRRDKLHCAICQRDISGLLARGAQVHIDHIIPLNLGGVNDATNLQTLCDKCNGEKGGSATTTSELVPNFW